MTTRNLGDFELEDYVRVVRKRSHVRGPRALLLAGACIGCFGAGYVSPRPGKNSLEMTLQEAATVLERAPQEDWQHEQAVGALGRGLRASIESLSAVAIKNDPAAGQAGAYANIALYHAASSAIKGLTRLRDEGINVVDNKKWLELLEGLTKK